MTSGKFKSFPITSITIERSERQRRELKNIDELAESIHRIGLINPIVVTTEGLLVAGERRLTACKQLGWTSIPVQFTFELSNYELQTIELEENIKREDLPWQDQCLAIAKFHELKKANEDEWTQEATAQALGITQPHVARNLEVAKEITSGNEKVSSADKFSVARNIVQRNTERKQASDVSSAIENFSSAAKIDPLEPEVQAPPILNTDFHLWQESYNGPRFNLIHCDFPYGINVSEGPRQNSAIQDGYADSADIYFSLLDRLASSMDNVVAESAHLIFWYSMNYHYDTYCRLTEMGWTVNPFPLIWHKSDNAGIAPDPQRWGRRTYETAFMASRGDRKLTQVGARSNSYAHPGSRDGAIHISEKPLPVLSHFLSMVCDEYSLAFDPTCGSGNALKAAQRLEANSVLGLELNNEFYTNAIANWSK